MSKQDVTDLAAEQPVKKVMINESLITCGICLEIMHNSMNITPCNHKFCAACIYEWHSEHENCPTCRWYVMDITRDAMASEIIEAFLDANPEKNRSEECKNRLDVRELHHLEQYAAMTEDMEEEEEDSELETAWDLSELDATTADSINGSVYGEDEWSDEEMSDGGTFSDMSEYEDSQDEARELEVKARRDIDAARILRLRNLIEARAKAAEAALKKEKRRERKRNSAGSSSSAAMEPVRSKRSRPNSA